MPYDVEWNEQGVYRKFYGHVTGDEVIANTAAIFSDQQFDHIRYLVSDYLGVTSSDISMEQASYIAHMCYAASKSNVQLKAAMVVEDETLDALGALVNFEIEELAIPWETNFFRSQHEVMAWVS